LEWQGRDIVQVVRYNALSWYNFFEVNNRTHRKIMVVDGQIGFTGRVGVADHWLGNARNKDEWRDTHYRVEGPVVGELQSAFMDNWLESTGGWITRTKNSSITPATMY
jgi:cardiolipin synthase